MPFSLNSMDIPKRDPFAEWIWSLRGLDRGLAEGLFGTKMEVYDDIYTRSKVYYFNNGKSIKFPIDKLLRLSHAERCDYFADEIAKQIGTVHGCKQLLRSFADCEVNRVFALETAGEMEEDDG